jgi:hypothetical protein
VADPDARGSWLVAISMEIGALISIEIANVVIGPSRLFLIDGVERLPG